MNSRFVAGRPYFYMSIGRNAILKIAFLVFFAFSWSFVPFFAIFFLSFYDDNYFMVKD